MSRPPEGLRTWPVLFRDTFVTRDGSERFEPEADVRRGDRFNSQPTNGGP